ncbi:MAG: MFS transporter [Acidobacteriia bacterium]|nr:MFS transporter [Terriglobia bacterium]
MNRTNIRKAYAAAFLKNLQFFGPISVPYFLDWLRVDYTRMFVLQAWFLFWVFVLEIPTGVVADKFGRKISVALGCILFASDMLFFGLSSDYYLLFAAEFLGAVGMTLISGADQALLYDSLIVMKAEERARFYFSRYEAAGTLGLLVSFPIGSSIAGLRNYPNLLPVPFIMTAISAILAAGMFLWMREPPRTKPKQGFIQMGVLGLRTLFARKELRAYVLNAVTISAVTFFAFWFYQPVTQRAGLRVAYLGWIGAGFNLFSAVLLTHVGLLEKAIGVKHLLLFSALVPGVLFIALGFVHPLAFAIPALFVLVGCKMVRIPVLNEFINRHIESENRATVISSVSLLERSVTFLLYPIVGLLADVSLDYVLWLLGGVCLVFAAMTRLSDRHLRIDESLATAR